MTDKTTEITELDDQDLETVSAGGATLSILGESETFPIIGETETFPVQAKPDVFARKLTPKLTGLAPRRGF